MFEQWFESICILLRSLDHSQVLRVLLFLERVNRPWQWQYHETSQSSILLKMKRKKCIQLGIFLWDLCHTSEISWANLLPGQTCFSFFLSSLQQFNIQATSLKPLELLLIIYLCLHVSRIRPSTAFFVIFANLLCIFPSARKWKSKET